MAHFYGTMKGGRGEATRTGTKNSGMTAHIRGWDAGCEVVLTHQDGKDVMYIYWTTGSNGKGTRTLLGQVVGNELVASDLGEVET